MTAIDTAKAVLAKASLFDQTMATPDLGIAVAWSEVFGDVDRADALAAVTEHYSQPNPRRIMPGDVLVGVRKIRAERIRTASSALLEPPDVDYLDIPAYLAGIRERRAAIAAGRPVTPEPQAEQRDVQALLRDRERATPRMPAALPEPNDPKRRSA